MILSDRDILKMIEAGKLKVSPFDKFTQLQPASVDFTLGDSYAVLKCDRAVTLDEELEYTRIKSDKYTIEPGEFVLATTQEYFEIPDNLTAFVEGRSSIGRLGLFIQNAGWVDPGFEGEITLELYNASNVPIVLEKGRRVGQLVFARMINPAKNPYRGKYQGQQGATGSKINRDYELESEDD